MLSTCSLPQHHSQATKPGTNGSSCQWMQKSPRANYETPPRSELSAPSPVDLEHIPTLIFPVHSTLGTKRFNSCVSKTAVRHSCRRSRRTSNLLDRSCYEKKCCCWIVRAGRDRFHCRHYRGCIGTRRRSQRADLSDRNSACLWTGDQ